MENKQSQRISHISSWDSPIRLRTPSPLSIIGACSHNSSSSKHTHQRTHQSNLRHTSPCHKVSEHPVPNHWHQHTPSREVYLKYALRNSCSTKDCQRRGRCWQSVRRSSTTATQIRYRMPQVLHPGRQGWQMSKVWNKELKCFRRLSSTNWCDTLV